MDAGRAVVCQIAGAGRARVSSRCKPSTVRRCFHEQLVSLTDCTPSISAQHAAGPRRYLSSFSAWIVPLIYSLTSSFELQSLKRPRPDAGDCSATSSAWTLMRTTHVAPTSALTTRRRTGDDHVGRHAGLTWLRTVEPDGKQEILSAGGAV